MTVETDPELRRLFDEYEAAWIARYEADQACYAEGVWDKTIGGDFVRSAAGIEADETHKIKLEEYLKARRKARLAIAKVCGVGENEEERYWKLTCLFR